MTSAPVADPIRFQDITPSAPDMQALARRAGELRARLADAASVEACLEVLRRVAHYTRIPRLLTKNGRPAFNLTFYALNKKGEYGSASMYPSRYTVCTPDGVERLPTKALYTSR